MDLSSLNTVLMILEKWGPFGLIILFWWLDMRSFREMMEAHKQETQGILEAYRKDMAETRRMYENNVSLVKAYEKMSQDLHEIVVLNIRQFTTLNDKIDQNQFCPSQRIK